MIRIGVDVQSMIDRPTGLGVYTTNLVNELKEMKLPGLVLNLFRPENAQDFNTLNRLKWENINLPRLVKKSNVDILHIPAFSPPFRKICKTVVTVHDLIGKMFPNQMRWPSRFYWGKWLPHAISTADAIIADSENTKKDIIEQLRIPEKKIHLIYPSGHERFSRVHEQKKLEQIKNRYGIKDKYLLFVGTIEPRKNLKGTLEAFKNLKKRGLLESYQLVISGKKSFGKGKHIQNLNCLMPQLDESIIFTGYTTHEELNYLFCGAKAFLFPSFYEGFGIPILEAMACGVPVITSKTSSLPEAAGDSALLVDPNNPETISNAILRIINDPALAEELVQKGFLQTQRFSWRKCAEEVVKVYESVYGN